MNKVTAKTINRLAHYEGSTALTIYMPLGEGVNAQQDHIRLKTLVRSAREQLDETKDATLIKTLDALSDATINDSHIWNTGARGLALFANDKITEIYHLPIEVEEQSYVGAVFDTLPLYKLQTLHQQFYLFALAQHDPKLFYGDIYGLEPVELDLPRSAEDALNIDEMFINSNTVRAGSGSMQGSPHGQGDSQQAGQEERLMYFRILDDLIRQSHLVDDDLPIMIAATESEAADFKSISNLSSIIDAHIAGNRTKDDLKQLHEIALTTIQEVMESRNKTSFEEMYEEKRGADKATSDLNEIQRAAESGRVDTLILGVMAQDSVQAQRDIKNTLLQLVRAVLRGGGNVHAINQLLIPGKSPAAAVLRY